MISHLKSWWATHLTWIGLLVSFLTPSVNAFVSAHPSVAVTIGAAWGILLHMLPSPVTSPASSVN